LVSNFSNLKIWQEFRYFFQGIFVVRTKPRSPDRG
jgi:hypothetical protein